MSAATETLRPDSQRRLSASHGGAVHLSLSGMAAAQLRLAADDLAVRPQALAAALLTVLLRDGMVDSVLDGADPTQFSGRTPARHGLTSLRCAVLYVLALHADADGVVQLSARALARLCGGGSHAGILSAMDALAERGLLLNLAPAGHANQPRICRLTPQGLAVAADLGDLGYAPGGGRG